MMYSLMTVACAWARLPARSDQGSLELFCSPFFFQEKRWERIQQKDCLKQKSNYKQMPHQARHDSTKMMKDSEQVDGYKFNMSF